MSRHGNNAAASFDHLRSIQLNVSDTPDLVPPLAVAAAFARGSTVFTHAKRLCLKESDRLATIANALNALGGQASVQDGALHVEGMEGLDGGEVSGSSDHRIVMMAAIAAAYADGPTTITNAEAVAKSYPTFFEDFRSLGGIVELSDGLA